MYILYYIIYYIYIYQNHNYNVHTVRFMLMFVAVEIPLYKPLVGSTQSCRCKVVVSCCIILDNYLQRH